MTQDCLNSPSTADVSKRLPKGIHVIGAERLSDPSVEGISRRKRIKKKEDPSTDPTSWSYIFILHMAAKGMEKWLEAFNADEKNTQQPFFIHKYTPLTKLFNFSDSTCKKSNLCENFSFKFFSSFSS